MTIGFFTSTDIGQALQKFCTHRVMVNRRSMQQSAPCYSNTLQELQSDICRCFSYGRTKSRITKAVIGCNSESVAHIEDVLLLHHVQVGCTLENWRPQDHLVPRANNAERQLKTPSS